VVLIVREGAAARKKKLAFAPFLTFGAVAALALGAPHVL
jgi:prepilin signal peptidase PulO-like enzyme (type II secretory pathway)